MSITVQSDVFVILGLTALLCVFCVVMSKKIDKMDPMEKPKGFVLLMILLCEWLEGQTKDNVGTKISKKLSPYIVTIALYIFLSNILGLFGFSSPTGNFSVTLTLTIITWTMQQIASIKGGGFKAYMHAFIEPIPVFLPMNIFGKFSTLLSMSLRLFGNILSGSIIMQLVYSFTQTVSNGIVGIFTKNPNFVFNFMGPILAPVLHAYFDVFAGAIQTLIFITLTMVFIGNELPDDMKKITD